MGNIHYERLTLRKPGKDGKALLLGDINRWVTINSMKSLQEAWCISKFLPVLMINCVSHQQREDNSFGSVYLYTLLLKTAGVAPLSYRENSQGEGHFSDICINTGRNRRLSSRPCSVVGSRSRFSWDVIWGDPEWKKERAKS